MSSVRVRLGPPLRRNDISPPAPPFQAAFGTALTHAEALLLGEGGLLDIPAGHGRCPGMTASDYQTANDLAGPDIRILAGGKQVVLGKGHVRDELRVGVEPRGEIQPSTYCPPRTGRAEQIARGRWAATWTGGRQEDMTYPASTPADKSPALSHSSGARFASNTQNPD